MDDKYVITESGRKMLLEDLVEHAREIYKDRPVISDFEADLVWGTSTSVISYGKSPIGILNCPELKFKRSNRCGR